MASFLRGMPTTWLTCKSTSEHAQYTEAHQAEREAASGLRDPRKLQPLTRKGACCPVIAANCKEDLQ